MIRNFTGKEKDGRESGSSTRIYLYSTSDEELSEISNKNGIEMSLLKLALDKNALSRIHQDQVTYAIFDIPVTSKNAQHQRVKTYPVGLYYKDDVFVAVSNLSYPIISEILSDPQMPDWTCEELFLHLIYAVAEMYIKLLNHIDRETELLENQMKRRVKNTVIFQLMEYQRSLTALTTSIRGLKRLLSRLKERNYCLVQSDLLDDVIVATEQAGEMAEIFDNDLNALMDGFGSITSNSVNDIMKILTALTLILSIPMVMAALYGMNVRLPLAEDVNAFWYVCGASAVIALGTSIWFYFKKMF